MTTTKLNIFHRFIDYRTTGTPVQWGITSLWQTLGRSSHHEDWNLCSYFQTGGGECVQSDWAVVILICQRHSWVVLIPNFTENVRLFNTSRHFQKIFFEQHTMLVLKTHLFTYGNESKTRAPHNRCHAWLRVKFWINERLSDYIFFKGHSDLDLWPSDPKMSGV